VTALSKLSHLACLSLAGAGLSPQALVALAAALPGLRALSLAGCLGLGATTSSRMTPLASSSTSFTPVAAAASGEWAAALARMPSLQWLDLRGVRDVTQAHVRALAPALLAAGRLGPGSLALDDELARRIVDSGNAARGMRLADASDDEVARWSRVELEVRAPATLRPPVAQPRFWLDSHECSPPSH